MRCAVFVISFAPASAFSQILPFKTYTVKDGLLSNDIEAVAQDWRGFMWFGTTDGISVFDGKSFTNYTIHDGLPHSVVTQILSDRKNPGTVWIIAGQTLCKYVNGQFTVVNIDVNVLYTLYQDIYGVIWCGTDRGAYIIDGNVVTPFYPARLAKDVSSIAEVGDSLIWFARINSLTRYSRITKQFREIAIGDNEPERFGSMLPDREGNLWVTYGFGCILRIRNFSVVDRRVGHHKGETEFSGYLYKVDGKELWLFGYDGLYRIPKSHFTQAPNIHYSEENGLPEKTIRSTFIDREGNLWLGGRDHGIAKLSSWNILRFPLGSVWFVHHHQFAVADSNNHIWVIAQETLMEFWNDRAGGWHQCTHNIAIPDSLILPDVGGYRKFSSLFYDRKGRLWISTVSCPGRIDCYEIIADPTPDGDHPSEMKLIKSVWIGFGQNNKEVAAFIFCFLIDRKDDLWVSIANKGVVHYEIKRSPRILQMYTEKILVNYVRSLYEDRAGNVWAGSFNSGLYRFSPEKDSGNLRRYTTTDGLPDNATWDVREDRSGKLTIGTSNGGYAIFGRDTIRSLSVKTGLPSNKVFSMTQDSMGRLWLATSLGMVYEDHPGSTVFLKNQAYVGSSALCCGTTRNGNVWFVTANDLIISSRGEEPSGRSFPPTSITGWRVNGTMHPVGGDMQFSYDENNCEINYIGVSFKDENAIRYRYRLLSVDKAWHEPTYATSVTYNHLGPGSYRFEVTAITIDGAESPVPAVLAFTIHPPYWATWWFRSLGALIIFSIGLMIYYRKISGLKEAQAVQQEFSRRLIESQEIERKRVAGELHDDLGQELMVIINRAQMGLNARSLESAQGQLAEILQSTERGIESVREIAFNLSPYHLDHLGLTEALRAMVGKVAAIPGIKFSFDADPIDGLLSKGKEINVYRIVQECVNNVGKHSSATKATIRIRLLAKKIEIAVSDDGKGFDVTQKDISSTGRHGFGLSGLSERVKLLDGDLTIDSEPGAGTTITVSIPYDGTPQRGTQEGGRDVNKPT
jgi:signal transduction histidine kinase/ligand-binding sensor domain-containing protein